MSARTEHLLEEIKQAEAALAEARSCAHEAIPALEATLAGLRAKLTSAAEALTENKQILKD